MTVVTVISAFDEKAPLWKYDSDKGQFFTEKRERKLFACGFSKISMIQERFRILQRQLFCDERFSPEISSLAFNKMKFSFFSGADEETFKTNSLLDFEENSSKFIITPVESLGGNPGEKVVFGLLSLVEEGTLHIEGLNASVPLDTSNCALGQGIFCEGTFVLAKGIMEASIFRVSEMILPPVTQREVCDLTRNFSKFHDADMSSQQPHSSGIVILNQVCLYDEKILSKMMEIFRGFEEADSIPSAFVLFGNFFRKFEEISECQKIIGNFSEILLKFPKILENSSIILIPGPDDSLMRTMPCFPLEQVKMQSLPERQRQKLILASNPCKILVGDKKELVCMRFDLLNSLSQRNLSTNSSTSENAAFILGQYVLSQMSLLPPCSSETPILWDFDDNIRLYPIPHCVLIGDGSVKKCENVKINGCDFGVVARFDESFEFFVYNPEEEEEASLQLSSL